MVTLEYSISPEAHHNKERHGKHPAYCWTYKRTGNDAADLAAANDLKKDPKETAEHAAGRRPEMTEPART
jgi:anthranilate synthase component 1